MDIKKSAILSRPQVEEAVAAKLKVMADSIFPEMFQVTPDIPSLHNDGQMPILDLKVWVNNDNMILHTFYAKPVSYNGLIRAD